MMNKKYMAILLGATMGFTSLSASAATATLKNEVKTEAAASQNNKNEDNKKADSKKEGHKTTDAMADAETTDKCFLGQVVKSEKEQDGSVKVSLRVVKTGKKDHFKLTKKIIELTLAKTVNIQKEMQENKDDKTAYKKEDKAAVNADVTAAKTDEKAAKTEAAAAVKTDNKKTADTAKPAEKATEKAAAKTAEQKDGKANDKTTQDLKTVFASAEKKLDDKVADKILQTVMDKGSVEDLKEGTVVLISYKEADNSVTDVRVLTSIKIDDKKTDSKAEANDKNKTADKTTDKVTENKDIKAQG